VNGITVVVTNLMRNDHNVPLAQKLQPTLLGG